MEEMIINHLGSILVILFLAIIKAIETIKKRKKSSPKTLAESNEFNEVIYPVLWNTLLKFRAIRNCILQFHNGERYVSGGHVWRVTMTHEVVNPDIPKIRMSVQGLNMPAWVDKIYSYLRRGNNHYYIEDTSKDSSDNGIQEIHDQLKSYGCKSALFLPIYSNTGEVIAIKMLQFNYGRPLNDGLIRMIMNYNNEVQNLFRTLMSSKSNVKKQKTQ